VSKEEILLCFGVYVRQSKRREVARVTVATIHLRSWIGDDVGKRDPLSNGEEGTSTLFFGE